MPDAALVIQDWGNPSMDVKFVQLRKTPLVPEYWTLLLPMTAFVKLVQPENA